MKIVSRNKDPYGQNIIPINGGISENLLDVIFDFVLDAYFQNEADYSGTDLQGDRRRLVRDAVEQWSETIIGKQLAKKFVIDDCFLRYVEDSIYNAVRDAKEKEQAKLRKV